MQKFYRQVVLIYLQLFCRDLLLKCVPHSKIGKNLLKPRILLVQVVEGHLSKLRYQCLLCLLCLLMPATVFKL